MYWNKFLVITALFGYSSANQRGVLVPEGACKDLGRPDQCQVRGKCITGNMLTNCMKSCGTCPQIPAPKEKGMLICADARSGSTCPAYGIQEGCDRGDCYKRSQGGECGSNPNYMLRYCQFSCKLCDQITNWRGWMMVKMLDWTTKFSEFRYHLLRLSS